jgi:hypothetical protein
MNYTQQQSAYLQAWRQVLEPLMPIPQAMSHPGGAWPMPAMPPHLQSEPPAPPGMPAAPPVAPDYAQQLFSYLQAWRQSLEAMVGSPPVPAQPSGRQPYDTVPSATPPSSTPPGNGGTGYGRPNVPVPPENPGVGRSSGPAGLYYGESSPKVPPKFNAIPALNETGSQQPGEGPVAAKDPQRLPVNPKFLGQSAQVPKFDRQDERARGPRVVTPLGPRAARQRSLFTGLAERAALRDGG